MDVSRALLRAFKLAAQLQPEQHHGLKPQATSESKPPLRVLVTGAAGQIAYSLIFMIASGNVFGSRQELILHLLDIPPMKQALEGVQLEIEDGAFPLLKGLVATVDVKEAFTGVDFAILVGSFPRKDGMERKDLLEKNAAIFREQGKALNDFASRHVKVLVVGNPANTNALIAMACAPSIPRENFTALTRLDHNRAKNQIARKLDVNPSRVHNVIIWGNHSSTQYPDVNHGHVSDFPVDGLHESIRSAVNDEKWLQEAFIPAVQKRGAAVIKARKLSSAASAANAVADHLRDWFLGTPKGEVVSMAVPSDGSYGIPQGVIYSYPCTCSNGRYSIVQGLKIDSFSREKMTATHTELLDEKKEAFAFLGLTN